MIFGKEYCNEKLREIFSGGKFVVVTNHIFDINVKGRNNSENAQRLESQIIEKGFDYNKFSEKIQVPNRKNPEKTHKEKIVYFVVREEISEDEIFKNCLIKKETQNAVAGKTFMLPTTESEKSEFEKKRIIFPEDMFVWPDELGEWEFFEPRNFYVNKFHGNIIALVCANYVAVGSYIPAGVNIKKQETNSLEESLEFLRNYHLKRGRGDLG